MAEKQPKKFKYTISVFGNDTEINNAPVEWSQTQVEFKRSSTYWGVIRSLTLPFNFTFKGAGIIRQALYTTFLSSIIKLFISKLNTLTWQYVNIFSGKMDLTTVEDIDNSIQVNIIEDNFNQKVDSFDDVEYEIPLEVDETVVVELTPIPFKEKADWILIQTVTEATAENYFPKMNLVSSYEQHSIIASARDVEEERASLPIFETDPSYFFDAQTNTNVILTGRIFGLTVKFGSTSDANQIVLKDQNGNTIHTFYNQLIGSSGSFDVSFNFSLTANFNDRFYLYVINNNNASVIVGGGEFHLSYNTESAATKCNALRASYVYDFLIQAMNGKGQGGAYVRQETQSYLLTSTLKNVVITCSNSIRKIVNGTQYNPGDSLLSGAKYSVINGAITYNSVNYNIGQIFTAVDGVETFTTGADGSVVLVQYREVAILKFKDFFQSVYAWMGGNVGYGMDGNIATLESLSVYLRNIVMLDLGLNIEKNPKRTVALDLLFKGIKVGMDDQQYDTLNGFQEVMGTQNYLGDNTNLEKTLDLTSPIRIDPYGIETLRFTPADTSASRSDNDVWAIWIKDEPEIGQTYYHPLRTEGLISITGIDNPETYYNWELTPKRCLYRGAPYLASIFWKQTTIHYKSSQKNVNLVTVDLNGFRVAERDDIIVANLGKPLFIPFYYELNVSLQEDALNQLNVQYGQVAYTYRNTKFTGFISDASVDVGLNSKRTFKLIAGPDDKFGNLIH